MASTKYDKEPFSQEIEYFIEDWDWDGDSHTKAREMAIYFFDFLEHLEQKAKVAAKELRKHKGTCGAIGYLYFLYLYKETKYFDPSIFLNGPHHESEFALKFSNITYQKSSYRATYKKLKAYLREREKGER